MIRPACPAPLSLTLSVSSGGEVRFECHPVITSRCSTFLFSLPLIPPYLYSLTVTGRRVRFSPHLPSHLLLSVFKKKRIIYILYVCQRGRKRKGFEF
jgi:hypothetical protein